MSDIDDKVKELESLVVYCKVIIVPYANSTLADIHIHLTSALFRQELTVSAVEPLAWLDGEIANRKIRHPEAYWVYCIRCGHVPLGWDEYNRQMNHADNLWKCPLCGLNAHFDDDTYEKVYYPDGLEED